MLDLISEQLARLEGPGRSGSFVTRSSAPATDLSIEVRGVGKLRLPVTAAQSEELRRVARPAPFGWHDQTLRDSTVRNTWEIAKSRVKIAARGWKATLAAELDRVRCELGLPEGCVLEPVFDKLLLYERGQFFKSHQDSERDDAMVGTLLVVLPSQYTGGTLRVEHKGKSKSFHRLKSQATELALIAFYADCRHDVVPIKSGHRVVLSFQLHLGESTGVALPAVPRHAIETLAARVRGHFETPIEKRWSSQEPQPPERLVYLLDHEYSKRSLSWGRLKGADRVRVSALCQVADHLDCQCVLTLADVREVWDCLPEFEPVGYWGREYREVEGGDHTLENLIDDSVELHHWIDRDGKIERHANSRVDGTELCFTLPSRDMDPFESQYAGYQGNYGNTEERWCHRAALVMWPRGKVVGACISEPGDDGDLEPWKRSPSRGAQVPRLDVSLPSSVRAVLAQQVFVKTRRANAIVGVVELRVSASARPSIDTPRIRRSLPDLHHATIIDESLQVGSHRTRRHA